MPLVIQDRSFDRDNQLVYMTGHPMERMLGFLGDRIMVNGLPDFTLPVSANAYRLRLLNGSNSRVYRIAWQDGRPLTIIGTDGGLLERPVRQSYAFLSPWRAAGDLERLQQRSRRVRDDPGESVLRGCRFRTRHDDGAPFDAGPGSAQWGRL